MRGAAIPPTNHMEDNSARSSAPPTVREETRDNFSQPNLTANLRGFLVLLPGLCTLIIWELAAWQWSSVAKLVSQPTEIARGIVDAMTTE